MVHQPTQREVLYWPGMTEDVRNWCQTSAAWATKKLPTQRACAPLQTVRAGHPMQILVVDNTGLFPESDAVNRYVMIVDDYFTC